MYVSSVFLYCCPDFILSKKFQDVTPTLFLCFEFLDHIKFCKVVLNIFKGNMEYSVHSAHFNFYLKQKKKLIRKTCIYFYSNHFTFERINKVD